MASGPKRTGEELVFEWIPTMWRTTTGTVVVLESDSPKHHIPRDRDGRRFDAGLYPFFFFFFLFIIVKSFISTFFTPLYQE
jgi:hypothetical protein